MNHPATFVLPLSAGRVLDVLHSMFTIGELIAISQDEIAHRGCISEASVSRAMPVLVEHGFIERSPFDREMNGGRGGYWIRLLPLPALEGSTTDPLLEGSVVDPLSDDAESRAPMLDMAFTASPCGTDQLLIPPPPPMVHDLCFNNSSNMRAREQKNDWSGLTIAGADFIPIAALERAGQTPESVRQADTAIQTRHEYPRSEQIRILFRCLLTNQPIIGAAEIAARSEEVRRERPAERPARRDQGDHGRDRPGRSDRRQDSQRPRAAATRFSRESYRGCAHD